MPGIHECPYCHYKFEDRTSLNDHLDDGSCPEEYNSPG